MHISYTAKLSIVLFFITLIVYGGVIFMYLSIRSMSAEASRLADDARIAEQRRDQFQSIREMVINNKGEIETLNTYFIKPNVSGTAHFLNELESLAEVSNARITTDSVTLVENKNVTQPRVELALSVSGLWHQVYHTLALVETMPFDIRLSQAQFSMDTATQWSGLIKMSIAKRIATSTESK